MTRQRGGILASRLMSVASSSRGGRLENDKNCVGPVDELDFFFFFSVLLGKWV